MVFRQEHFGGTIISLLLKLFKQPFFGFIYIFEYVFLDNPVGDDGIFGIFLACHYNDEFTILFEYCSFDISDIIDSLFTQGCYKVL